MGGLMKIYTRPEIVNPGDAGGHRFAKGAESITYENSKWLILNENITVYIKSKIRYNTTIN
jgi:hypothetical protein